MLTAEISLPDVEELNKLVQDGLEKGFLTYDEIVVGLEDVELTKDQAEDGSRRAHRPALHAFLRPLGLELPDDFARVRLVNAHGEIVGEAVCET